MNAKNVSEVKTIKRVSELPSWFVLSKYKGARLLDGSGWYEQLIVRKDLLDIVTRKHFSDHFSWEKDLLMAVRDSPIFDTAFDERLRSIFSDGALSEIKNRRPCYTSGVRIMTVRDLYRAENFMDPLPREGFRSFFAYYHGNDNWDSPRVRSRSDDWVDERLDRFSPHGKGLIHVNLNLPDNLLLDQFKRCLVTIRSGNQEMRYQIKNHSKLHFPDWVSYGVLPYLDLKIWSKENHVRIPNRVIADAIFYPGEGGEEVVRKTTAKIAMDLISCGHLEKLAALAAQEITDRRNR